MNMTRESVDLRRANMQTQDVPDVKLCFQVRGGLNEDLMARTMMPGLMLLCLHGSRMGPVSSVLPFI